VRISFFISGAVDPFVELQGLQEDEKRADIAKANIIAKHFPRMSSETAFFSLMVIFE
jgi:hypothetical protein